MRTILIGCFVCLVAACGDDPKSGGDIVDAAAGVIDAAGVRDGGIAVEDAGSGGGTQGVGQFCNTLPDGGPFCMDGLECCSDKLCQVAGECGGGQTGFIPCECTDDCSGGNICCESATQTFCTKRNGCTAVSGTEVTVCP